MNASLNNPGDFPPEKEPNLSLLLTVDEERSVREKEKSERYIYKLEQGDKKLLIFGSPHIHTPDSKLIEEFKSFDPQVVLTENPISIRLLEGIDIEEAAKRGGESAVAAFKAREKVLPFVSWDILHSDLVKEAFTNAKFPKIAVIGNLLGHVARDLQREGRALDYEEIRRYFSQYLSPDDPSISQTSLDLVAQTYRQKDMMELTEYDANNLAMPGDETDANKVSKWMNEQRDPHAVKEIWKFLSKYDRVFVVGGRSHTMVWKPVFEDLMGKAEQLN